MNKRIALVFAILLVLSSLASAQVYQITTKSIEIAVDEDGGAQITEKFFLSFPDAYQVQLFREEIVDIGVDLWGWQQLNDEFKPTLGKEQDQVVSDIGFVENDFKYLEIKYTLKEPLMAKQSETSRRAEFALNEKFFSGFLDGSLWVLPTNVSIIIDLPLQAELTNDIKPEANVSGNRIVWTGYKSTNVLSLKYTLWKQISTVTLNELAAGIAQSELFTPLLGVSVVILLAIVWKRKAIAGKIESYLVENSEFAEAEEED